MPEQKYPQRRNSLRLEGFDYTQAGVYFFTTCVQHRERLLGSVRQGEMHLSGAGRIVHACWEDLAQHYPGARLDLCVVMPDHFHGVLLLAGSDPVGADLRPARGTALSEVVRAFKAFSARAINRQRGTPGQPVWQRGYFDRIVRDTEEWNATRVYILNNPLQWALDEERRMAEGRPQWMRD